MTTQGKTEVDLLLEKYNKPNPSSLVVFDSKGNKIKTFTEEEIAGISKEVLDYLLEDIRKYKDFGMGTKVLQQLIELKKAYFPATQVNKNLNVNLFDDQLSKWFIARKELKKMEEKQITIIENGI